MTIVHYKNLNLSFATVLGLHVLALFYSLAPSETRVLPRVISLRLASSNPVVAESLPSLPMKKWVAPPVPQKSEKKMVEQKSVASQEEQQVSVEQAVAVPASVVLNIKEQYQMGLRMAIDERKVVPIQAKKLRQSGGVQVSFTVLPDGTLTNVKIVESSSFSRLDQAALDLLTSIGKYRPFPRELSQLSQMDIAVEINYDLN